jgi:proline racemase
VNARRFDVETTDYHTAGEPFRIVTSGVPEVPGTDVRDRREHARRSAELDRVRQLLCHEPRGHADMYGCFPVPPDDAGARLGVLFWHRDGYSTACGHGTIALGAWAVESGLLPAPPDGEAELVVDVPSGRARARVRCEQGAVASVAFANVPAYVLSRDVSVPTGLGTLEVDLAWGGAIYACLPAAAAGLRPRPEDYTRLVQTGREIRDALNRTDHAVHPEDARLSGVYGTILYEDLGDTPDGPHQRNVTVFADGQVDRSPCGSGSSARAALLAAEGRLAPGRVLIHDSIVDTRFMVRILEPVEAHGREAVTTEIEGTAFRTGEHRFTLDPRDPLDPGFLLV